jgi:hypothetical protein
MLELGRKALPDGDYLKLKAALMKTALIAFRIQKCYAQ